MDIWSKEDFDQTIENIRDIINEARNYDGYPNSPKINHLYNQIKVSYSWALYEQADLVRLLNETEGLFGPDKIDYREDTPERRREELIRYKLGVLQDIEHSLQYAVSFLDKCLTPNRMSDSKDAENMQVKVAKRLPQELETTEAKIIFNQAVETGLAEADGDGYTWKGKVSELAAFIDCSSEALKIKPSNGRVPWRFYKQAFGLSDEEVEAARGAKKEYDSEKRPKPERWNMIYDLCN